MAWRQQLKYHEGFTPRESAEKSSQPGKGKPRGQRCHQKGRKARSWGREAHPVRVDGGQLT